jgi:hypothetical protein
LSIVNDSFGYWFGSYFAWKFNEIEVPPFYVNSYQQDYASSNTNIGWLQSGDCTDINNTGLPKAQPQVECVKDLPRASSWVALPPMFFGILKFQICWRYNSQLYYGTWGAANTGNATRGNNPQINSTYVLPLAGGQQMPFNPITQIQDANGNLLRLTTYGTTGSTAPLLGTNAPAGTTVTDGSCVWTVVSPTAQGFRIWPTPSQSGVVWQFNLRAQAKPPTILTTLDTLLTPLPDEYFHNFRETCIAMAYRYSAEEKIRAMHDDAIRVITDKIMNARMQGDREPETHSFIPSAGIVAPPGGTMPITPGNPFGVGGA